MCVRTVTTIVLLLATSAPQSGAQEDERKCIQEPTTKPTVWHVDEIAFIAYYNITEERDGRTCTEVVDHFPGTDDENWTIFHRINGTLYNNTLRVVKDTKQEHFSFHNNPNQKSYFTTEFTDGLLTSHACNGDHEYIVIGVWKGQDLSKEAEAKAKQLTDNPDDYKLDPTGCF